MFFSVCVKFDFLVNIIFSLVIEFSLSAVEPWSEHRRVTTQKLTLFTSFLFFHFFVSGLEDSFTTV